MSSYSEMALSARAESVAGAILPQESEAGVCPTGTKSPARKVSHWAM
jgi:hypothetical protein